MVIVITSLFSFALKDNHYQNVSQITVEIKGEVYFPATFVVDKTTTLGQLLQKVKPKFDADLNQFNKNQKFTNNTTIVIPKKDNINATAKLTAWKDLHTLNDFTSLKISNKVAKLLVELKNQKGNQVTWNDIENTKGIGKTIFKKLQNLITLDY
ncbi:MAG0490 family ComEA-like DNA-binding protein [Candidatus Mycoplasma pogonae]